MQVAVEASQPVAIDTAIARPDGGYEVRHNPAHWGDLTFMPFAGSLGGVWFPGDFDGDGKTDIMGVSRDREGKAALLVAISNGDGAYRFARQPTDIDWEMARSFSFSIPYAITLGIGPLSLGFSGIIYQGPLTVWMSQRWLVGDVNGDGRTDLMLANRETHHIPGEPERSTVSLCAFVATGDPKSQLPTSGSFTEEPCTDTSWEWDNTDVLRNRFYSGDVDGDGKSDFIMITRYKTWHGGDEYVRFYVGHSAVEADPTSGSRVRFYGSQHDPEQPQPWQDEDVWFPGDPNGDGKTDLMQVIKRGKAENARASLRTWLSKRGGVDFDPTPVQDTNMFWYLPPPAVWGEETWDPTMWFPGDADGDGHTDFMQVYRKHDHDPGTNDTSDPNDDDLKVDLAVAHTRPNGAYSYTTRETNYEWGDLGQAVGLAPTDVNGDGNDDVAFARTTPFRDVWQGKAFLSPNTRRDDFNWQSAEVTGDGRADLVYVEHLNPGIRVHTLARGADGSLGERAPPQNILPKEPELPGLDNPDTSHWMPVDINADGRHDLVYETTRKKQRCVDEDIDLPSITEKGRRCEKDLEAAPIGE